MANLAPGNSSSTAWAITCAVEWRRTWRPSSVVVRDDRDLVAVGSGAAEVRAPRRRPRRRPPPWPGRGPIDAPGRRRWCPRRGSAAEPSGSVIVMSAMDRRRGLPDGRCDARPVGPGGRARRRSGAARAVAAWRPFARRRRRRRDAWPARRGSGRRRPSCVAYSSTYSWPVSSRISYITSSVIWRSTMRSSAAVGVAARRRSGRPMRTRTGSEGLREPWRRAAGSRGCRSMPTGMIGHAGAQGQPGGAGVAPVQLRRRGSACPRGRCRTARPARGRRAAVSSAALAASPPQRSIGIMPMAGKRYLVFQESMYSALPTKVMRRGSTTGTKNESRTEVWLGQRIAAAGRRARARARSTWIRQSSRNTGRRTALATGPTAAAPRFAVVPIVATAVGASSEPVTRGSPVDDRSPRSERRRRAGCGLADASARCDGGVDGGDARRACRGRRRAPPAPRRAPPSPVARRRCQRSSRSAARGISASSHSHASR